MRTKRTYIYFLLAFLTLNVSGQDKKYIHLTPSSGLPSGFIYEIIEDRYGFIWMGTNAGLSQYNGYEFVNHLNKNANPAAIKGTSVSKIIDYDSTTLLVGTEQGLNIYDRTANAFSLIITKDSSSVIKDVIDILVLPENDLWIFTEAGLFFLPQEQLFKEKAEVLFYPIPEEREDDGSGLFGALKQHENGDLWLTSTRHPVMVFSVENKGFRILGPFNSAVNTLLEGSIWDILFASNGDALLGGDRGLIHWKKDEKKPVALTKLGTVAKVDLGLIQSISESPSGAVFIGTAENGGINWNLETNDVEVFLTNPSDQNSISSNDIHAMIEDSNQNVWFGHHNLGISMMSSNKLEYAYTSISEKYGDDAPVNNLFHATEDENGHLWFPTRGGLIYSDQNQVEVFNTPEKDGLVVSVDLGDRLLLVTSNGTTLYAFQKTEQKFSKIYQNDSIGIHGHFSENENFIFFPTVQGNIVKVDKTNFQVKVLSVPQSDLNTGIRISGVEQDAVGNMIVELYYYETRTIESFLLKPETNEFIKFKNEREITPATRVPPIPSKIEPLVMWERSVYGLRKTNLETGEYRVFFESEPVIQESQRGTIVEDDAGYLWMNTSTGIMRLDVINEQITQYTLPSNYKPERLVKPFLVDSSDILFTGYGGFVRFNAEKAKLDDALENLYIEQIILEDQTHDILYSEAPKNFEHAKNDLSISYFAINYPDPDGTRYRYRVFGQNQNWIEVGNLRRVFLANLDPGKYTFEVQAALRYGGYDITRSLDFIILPPWWRTWWAYSLYGILLIVMGFVVHRYQKKRTIRIERERIKDERLAQAHEIEKAYAKLKATQDQLVHSEKMASLGELTAGIAHEIQNPLNFVNNFAELSEELAKELDEEIKSGDLEEAQAIGNDLIDNLRKIHHHGTRASEIVKSMLQHSRTGKGEKETTDINILCEEYLRLAFHGLKAQDKSFNANFGTDLDPQLPKINVVPQEIGRVLLNLINNAFQAVRKVKNPKVVIRTYKMGHLLHIEVEDNGPGIAEELWVKIFQPFFTTKATGEGTGLGLSMSFDIITKGHGGTISVENVEQGSGAIFKVCLPL